MVEIYVNSNTGIDDVGSGTKEQPFLTLEYAVSTIYGRLSATLDLEEEGEKNTKDVAYTGDESIKFIIAKGEYSIDSISIFNGKRGLTTTVEGVGKNTVIKNKFSGGNGAVGTRGFSLVFNKFIWDNSHFGTTTVNNFLIDCEVYFNNIVFQNIQNDSYGWIGGGLGAWHFNCCVKTNYSTAFLRDDASGSRARINNCYGYFELGHGTPNYNGTNNVMLKSSDRISIDSDYNITDINVDTASIGVYVGDLSWLISLALIKQEGRYYSIIDELYNANSKEYRELTTADFSKAFDVTELTQNRTIGNETFKAIDKFNDFNLIFDNGKIKSINLQGYKIREKIVEDKTIDFRRVESVNNFSVNGDNVKVLFSFDEKTYNSYDFDNSNLIERVNLADIKDIGIASTIVNEIDFNKIKEAKGFNKIKLGYYLEQNSRVNSVVIEYVEKAPFQKMKDGKYNLCVNGKNIEFTASERFKMVKLNVMT